MRPCSSKARSGSNLQPPEKSRSTPPSSSFPRPSGWPRRGGCISGGSGERVRIPDLLLPASRAGPFRRNRVDEEMANPRRLRSEMEPLDPLLHRAVADRDPFMLSQVLGPRLHVVAFDEAP